MSIVSCIEFQAQIISKNNSIDCGSQCAVIAETRMSHLIWSEQISWAMGCIQDPLPEKPMLHCLAAEHWKSNRQRLNAQGLPGCHTELPQVASKFTLSQLDHFNKCSILKAEPCSNFASQKNSYLPKDANRMIKGQAYTGREESLLSVLQMICYWQRYNRGPNVHNQSLVIHNCKIFLYISYTYFCHGF